VVSPWHTHTMGLYALLKKRGTQGLLNVQNRGIFWTAYTMVVGR
jgi:hypothetical protein